jgi:hypothetical protein
MNEPPVNPDLLAERPQIPEPPVVETSDQKNRREAQERMLIQRLGNRRRVALQHNHGEPIRYRKPNPTDGDKGRKAP